MYLPENNKSAFKRADLLFSERRIDVLFYNQAPGHGLAITGCNTYKVDTIL